MKFSIITPTYKRADLLPRAVNSVLGQTYTDWELIIVNDSPDDTSYSSFEKTITDPRIIYLKNEQNMGVNFSRNRALDNISKDSKWIIFLDDDDWFAEDTLENFVNLIKKNPNENWFVTNRAYKDGRSLTLAPRNNNRYSYALDYLIFKRVNGDATHCIKAGEIKNIHFSKKILQGDEWFFFYQLGLKNKFFYNNYHSTISEGYNMESGLNFRKLSKLTKTKNILKLFTEGLTKKIAYHPSFLFYILGRMLVTLLK